MQKRIDKLIFFHMPKCAGRTITTLLNKNYSDQKRFIVYSDKIQEAIQNFNLDKFNLIEGHLYYEYMKHQNEFKFITVLRDPVERLISQYNHFRNMPNSVDLSKTMWEEKWSFRDFVLSEAPMASFWKNVCTSYLGKGHLETALRRLETFDFIGIFEEFPTTIKLMKKKYDLKGEPDTVGITPKKYKTKVSDSERELAHEVCWADRALYELAKLKFKQAKES